MDIVNVCVMCGYTHGYLQHGCVLQLNKKYGIERPREELYAELDAYIAAVGDNRFLGQSDAPTLVRQA